MTDSKPRPPHWRSSRTRPSTGQVEPDRCYLCGAPASSHCPQCRRPVCDADRVRLDEELQPLFGSDACAECARSVTRDLACGESQWARKRDRDQPHRTCSLCGRESHQVLPYCTRCGRHLCPEHAVRYRRRFRFGARDKAEAAWYWDYEVRCSDHQMNRFTAWLQRWEGDPTNRERCSSDRNGV
jgi:hypothetical protein